MFFAKHLQAIGAVSQENLWASLQVKRRARGYLRRIWEPFRGYLPALAHRSGEAGTDSVTENKSRKTTPTLDFATHGAER